MKKTNLQKYVQKINELAISEKIEVRDKLILALYVQERIDFNDARWIRSTYVSPNGRMIRYNHLVLN